MEEAPQFSGIPRNSLALSDAITSEIAAVVFQSKGATLREISHRLSVSRTTAIRWLAVMEGEGLLRRGFSMSGRRGRPQGYYHATEKLRRLVGARSSEALVFLTFERLRQMCKHLGGEVCALKSQICVQTICPYLQS